MISIVIPTISGREKSLASITDAYEETLAGVEFEIIVEKDRKTWPSACNMGYRRSSGDVVHFGADDLEPLPGWHQPAVAHLAHYDELPAAAVYDYDKDGVFNNADDGPDGAIVQFTRVPIMRRDQWQRIGAWPRLIYFADLWLSEKARSIGIETRILYGYRFVHHWSQIGRVDSDKNLNDAWRKLNMLRTGMV